MSGDVGVLLGYAFTVWVTFYVMSYKILILKKAMEQI